MARWSPTVQPIAPVASNAGLVAGIAGAGDALLAALEGRRARQRDDARYKDSQKRWALEQQRIIDDNDVRQAMEMERTAKADAQTTLMNALALQERGYTTGETTGDKLARATGPDTGPIPMSALAGAGKTLQARTDTVTTGGQTYRRDPAMDPREQARAERRLEQLSRQHFETDQDQRRQQFQAKEGAANRAVTLESLRRDRYSVVPTATGVMRFNATTGQLEPITVNGQPVAGAGGKTASAQANEAALYGSQMESAKQVLDKTAGADKPFGLFTQAGLNQAGNGFTGDLLAGLGRKTLTADEQSIANARDQFAAASVYAFSGKTATNPEKATMRSIFFMQPGEEAPELARQKAGNREVASLAMQARTQGRQLDLPSVAKHLLDRGYSETETRAILGAVTPYLAGGPQP